MSTWNHWPLTWDPPVDQRVVRLPSSALPGESLPDVLEVATQKVRLRELGMTLAWEELVLGRSAGMSAWQFSAPALVVAFLLGVFATTVYNPVSAILRERSKRFEAELFNRDPSALRGNGGTFWASQRSSEGQTIINAKSSRDQGVALNGVSAFVFDSAGHFKQH